MNWLTSGDITLIFHTIRFLKAYILAYPFSISSLFILRVTEGDCYRERTSVNFLNIAQGSLKEWKHEHSTAGDMRRKKAVNIFVSISIRLLEVYCFHLFVCSCCTSDSNQLFSLLIYLTNYPSPSSIWGFNWNDSNRTWKKWFVMWCRVVMWQQLLWQKSSNAD